MMKRLFIVLLVMVLCLTMFTACGTKPEDTSKESPAVDNKESTTVTFSMANVPLIDPATGYDEAAACYMHNVYDPLVWPDDEGVIQPWVATDWSVSDDGLTWTFSIRDDITFHNGELLTARDVAFSMKRLLDLGQGFSYLFSYVKDAYAKDDTTVVFELSEPFANFANCLIRLYIVDESQILEHKQDGNYGEYGDYGVNWLLAADAGSGPYMFEEISGESYVSCKKYDDYWYGWEENAPERFKIIGTTEAVTIMTMMSRHELEISDGYQTLESLRNLDNLDGVDLTSFNSAGLTYLTMNNQKPPTDDEHFRKALAYAIDYSTLVETLYPYCEVADDLVNPVIAGYTEGNWPYYYDLEKAKAELKKSKYYDQLDSITVDVVWNPENVEREQFFLVFQSTCAQLGIKVNVTQKSWIQVMEDSASPETTPNCFLIWTCPDYMEAGSILAAQWTIFDVGTWNTMDWVQDKEIDSAIRASLNEGDYDTRIDIYKDVISKLIDRCATVPVAVMYQTHACQTDYFSWRTKERADQGLPVCPVMGYPFDVKNMKIYPERR
jgi:peptide/nickel transport system substrate-binding protein